MDRHGYLSVGDLMNHRYCGRITWYAYVLGMKQRGTVKTEHGQAEHRKWVDRERRRWREGASVMARSKLRSVEIVSARWRLHGKLDALVGDDGSLAPYEVKATVPPERPWPEQLVQLAAYALLLEDRYRRLVSRGYLHYLVGDVVREQPITDAHKRAVIALLGDMQGVVQAEAMPGRAPETKCRDCVYRKICV